MRLHAYEKIRVSYHTTITMSLTKGVLKDLFSKAKNHSPQAPFKIQIAHIKPITLANITKYRVMVHDGANSIQGLVEESAAPKVEAESIDRYLVIEVTDYSAFNSGNNKRLLLIKDFNLVSAGGAKVNVKEFETIDEYFNAHPDEGITGNDNGSSGDVKDSRPTPQSTTSAPRGNVGKVVKIDAISPYSNNWTIKARVLYKGDMRHWQNAKGEGKLISVHLLDELDEIKVTAFNETADRVEKEMEEGKVYYVLKGRVAAANKRFNNLNHPYELTLERESVIEECFDTASVPKITYNYVKLDQVQNLDVGTTIDVIGVLKTAHDAYQITSKATGKPFDKRNLVMVDDLGFAIEVGLWNNQALTFNEPEGTVIAFKLCKINEFNGNRLLSLSQLGLFQANPDQPEAYELKGWFDNQGSAQQFKLLKQDVGSGGNRIANRKTIAEAQQENLGRLEKPDYFTIRATITYVSPKSFCYPACANPVENNGRPGTCNRKVIETNTGSWRCERCDLEKSEPTYRYITTVLVLDETGQMWLSLFDEDARKLFGIDAGEMVKYQKAQEEDPSNTEFASAFLAANYKEYAFRVRAKLDSYNDVERVRYQVLSLDDLDYVAEADYLATELEKAL